MSDFASESGRWYTPLGEPVQEVPAKKGGFRAPTIADARKMGLYPSVTSIIKCADRPALNSWMQRQVAMSALTMRPAVTTSMNVQLAAIITDAKEQGMKAAERGTAIHGAVEKALRGEEVPEEHRGRVGAVMAILNGLDQAWLPERSFAHPEFGYGGKVDIHSATHLFDIKTKDSIEDAAVYDEHEMQLAAYDYGLGAPGRDCGIIFVSRTEDEARYFMLARSDVARGWRMFRALLTYWQESKSYFPGIFP